MNQGVNKPSNLQTAAAVANSIRLNLARQHEEAINDINFFDDFISAAPDVTDSKQINNSSLRAAWNYADSYFDAVKHGVQDLDGIPWKEAVNLLFLILQDPLGDHLAFEPLIMRYS